MKADVCVGCMVPQFCVVVLSQVVVFTYHIIMNLAQSAYVIFQKALLKKFIKHGCAKPSRMNVDNTAESETCC